MAELGSGNKREISDIMLTRYASSGRGIRPENLPPAEDVKKVERPMLSAEKK